MRKPNSKINVDHLPEFSLADEPTPPAAPTRPQPPSTPVAPSGNAPRELGALGEEETPQPSSTATPDAPRPSYTQESTRNHLFRGETVTDPQSPHAGKWDGQGLHEWSALKTRVAQDGFRITKVTEDPTTGARRVSVERTGVKPTKLGPDGKPVNGKLPEVVTGKLPAKTVYPRSMTPTEIEAAGDLALQKALDGEAGTKLTPYGATNRANGTPADGSFEAVVPGSKAPLRVQGWYKQLPDGTKVITCHAPAYDNSWPTVPPSEW